MFADDSNAFTANSISVPVLRRPKGRDAASNGEGGGGSLRYTRSGRIPERNESEGDETGGRKREREREEEIKVRARKEVRLAKQWRNSSSQLS